MTAQRDVVSYADPYTRAPRNRWARVFVGSAIALSVVSLGEVLLGATEGPFFGAVRAWQAFVMVGGGCVLVFAWVVWVIGLGVAVHRRVLRRVWLVALIWAAVSVYFVSDVPLGYVADMSTYLSREATARAARGPSVDQNEFDARMRELHRRYIGGDLAEARQSLLESIDLLERASLAPDLEARWREMMYERLYVLSRRAGEDVAAKAYWIHLQYLWLRRFEKTQVSEEAAGRKVSEMTPEECIQTVEKLDGANTHGEGPAYLKRLARRGDGGTPATRGSGAGF